MSIYLSMQRVRFSSPDGYAKFQLLFSRVRRHLMELPGFLHLTWWQHADDPTWFNEVSFWASKQALDDWHMSTYHKHAKTWAGGGAILEDIIANFEHRNSRLLRVCPCCAHIEDKAYDLHQEQKVLSAPCPACEFDFPVMGNTATSNALFKDIDVVPAS